MSHFSSERVVVKHSLGVSLHQEPNSGYSPKIPWNVPALLSEAARTVIGLRIGDLEAGTGIT